MNKLNSPNIGLIEFLSSFFTKENFQHSHIWFLVDLFCFSMIYVLLHKWIHKLSHWKQWLDLRARFLILFGLCFLFILLTHTQIGKGESYYGIFKLTFMYQFVFFLSGVFCYHWKDLLILHPSSKFKPIAILIWSIIVSIVFMDFEITDPLWIYFSYVNPWFRSIHVFLWVLSPFLWTMFFVSFFVKWGNQEGKIGAYIIESSLPIYLLHHPISLIYAYIVKDLPYPLWCKFIFHNLVVLLFSFLLYEFLIQRSKPLRFLFGLKIR